MKKITEMEAQSNKNLLAKTVADEFGKKLDELLAGYIATNESEVKDAVSTVLSNKVQDLKK